jgi:hypothetical protein
LTRSIKMSMRKESDPAKIEQAAALLKQAGYHVYPDQRILTVEDAATIKQENLDQYRRHSRHDHGLACRNGGQDRPAASVAVQRGIFARQIAVPIEHEHLLCGHRLNDIDVIVKGRAPPRQDRRSHQPLGSPTTTLPFEGR